MQMQRLCRRFVNFFQGNNLVLGYQRRLLYSTSTATSASTDSFANYLVDSLGLSPQRAFSTSKRLSSIRKVNDFSFDLNAVAVVGFLKSYGFDDTHVRRIVSLYPQLLCYNVDDTLRPKLEYLQDQGFSISDIIQVVYLNPALFMAGVKSCIVPAFKVLREVMCSDTHVIAILKNTRFNISSVKHLMPNVALLTSYGIPMELIRKHILSFPAAFIRKPEIFKDMVTRVKNKWGLCPTSLVFLYGIRLASQYTEEVIKGKCQIFKSFGWSQSGILALMTRSPPCLHFSDATIKKKLTFLMNEVRLEPGYLKSKSVFFTCSLEKRIVPRYKILLFLKEKGLLKKNPSLCSAMVMPESRFLTIFVLPFKEIHEVYAKLTGCSMKMLTQEISEAPPLK